MAYATTTDLKQRLGDTLYARLTDRIAGTDADDAVAQSILDEAVALAESYLAKRFRTPIDLMAHPELANVLRARVLDVAEHLAWRTSPFVGNLPDRVLFLHEEALRWLEALAAGRIHLPAGAPPASRVAEDDAARTAGSRRQFTGAELDEI